MLTEDCNAYILARTTLSQVSLLLGIKLHLATEGTDLWRVIEDDMEHGLGPPPFWAFAWAGGQALAHYIGEHPEEAAGKKVLDFAAGCGLAGIAAALAGASHVEASDIDRFAAAAIALNAAANDVIIKTRLDDLVGSDEPWDVILAGDVAYHGNMAPRITDWLEARAKAGTVVLIGDPGRGHLPREKLRSLASYDIAVPLMLEASTVKRTDVWRFI
jgi:predicted nicotinamide N-methyase